MGKAELVARICKDISDGKLEKLEAGEFLHQFKALMVEDSGTCRCPKCGFFVLFGGVARDEPYLFCLRSCGWGVFTRGDLTKADIVGAMGGEA